MGQALNTQVNGSSGTCIAAADWLGKLYSEANQAAASIAGARNTAAATWRGPAHDAFRDNTANLDTHSTAIADRAFESEWALRDFADSLKTINAKMDDALGKAAAGALLVQGPIIVSPEFPARPASLPTGPCGTQQAAAIMQQNEKTLTDFNNGPLADYNRKAAVYNECKAIVGQARNLEQNAHMTLRQKMDKVVETASGNVSALFTAVARGRSGVGGVENTRRSAAAKSIRLMAQSKFLNDFALGVVDNANPLQQELLAKSAKLAEDGGKQATRAAQFEQWVKAVPPEVRKAVTAYAGQGMVENLSTHSGSVKVSDFVGRTMRAVPYVGAGLTLANESYGAAKGEKSWARATADATAAIGGGALGSALVGAAAGSAFGPVGTVVLGLAGVFGGAMFAQDIVKGFSEASN